MKKFEYKKECCLYDESRIEKLNLLGAEGWELVALTEYGADNANCYFYLKREIE